MEVVVHREAGTPPDDRAVEVVERKGVGHPDSICDAIETPERAVGIHSGKKPSASTCPW